MLTGNNIRSTEDALLYITDCNLATVAHMAMLKSKSKSEFNRQISIAQTAVDYIVGSGIKVDKGNRVNNVIECDGSVQKWADKYSD